jgi:hypothetical protein
MLGGNTDFTADMHQKGPQHESALALMQSQYAVSADLCLNVHLMVVYMLVYSNFIL